MTELPGDQARLITMEHERDEARAAVKRLSAALRDIRERALNARDISPAWRASFAHIADEALDGARDD